MYKKGHLGIALICYTPVAMAVSFAGVDYVPLAGVGYVVVLWASTFPDVDLVLVRWQSKLPDFLLNRLPYKIKHRGFTHTIPFGLVLSLVLAGLTFLTVETLITSGYVPTIVSIGQFEASATPTVLSLTVGLSCFWGIVSHILGDMITPMGIRPFRPVSDKKLKYTFELFGHRSVAKSSFWNGAFFTLGLLALIAYAITLQYLLFPTTDIGQLLQT